MRNSRKAMILAALVALATRSGLVASEDSSLDALQSWIGEHQQKTLSGESELWIDPTGNNADVSNATLRAVSNGIDYTWVYKGSEQSGELRWDGETLTWKDSWHQPEAVMLTPVSGHGSLIAAEYSYAAGTGPDWHWRIKLAERPDASLVLQMTNIAPWGEEARAVRTVVRVSE